MIPNLPLFKPKKSLKDYQQLQNRIIQSLKQDDKEVAAFHADMKRIFGLFEECAAAIGKRCQKLKEGKESKNRPPVDGKYLRDFLAVRPPDTKLHDLKKHLDDFVGDLADRSSRFKKEFPKLKKTIASYNDLFDDFLEDWKKLPRYSPDANDWAKLHADFKKVKDHDFKAYFAWVEADHKDIDLRELSKAIEG